MRALPSQHARYKEVLGVMAPEENQPRAFKEALSAGGYEIAENAKLRKEVPLPRARANACSCSRHARPASQAPQLLLNWYEARTKFSK
jgi:hypothetical protein